MTTCVLGAGLQGVMSALELAERGHRVVVFDAASRAFTGASLHNEGKIHLGYVFAKDTSNKTAGLLAYGSTRFCQLLGRWWPAADIEATSSEPFDYLVLPEGLEDADFLERRYRDIDETISAQLSLAGRRYLGRRSVAPVRRLDRAELECRYNVHGVDAAFRTEERAVDPTRMAEVLRDALVAHPAIECCWSTRIDAVEERPDSKYWVRCGQDYRQGPFDNVVNALWGDRLRIDETVGVRVSRPYLFRQKVANRIRLSNSPEAWRSVTMVIGPFGDFVALPNRSCYLSWYPTGCIRRTNELAPPPAWEHTPQDQLRAIYNDCVVALSRRINGLDRLVGHAVETRSDPGVIFCWGDTDVEDPQSELHLRHEIGVSNPRPGYYSIDTGKLTTAPIFAEQVATMIGPK